MPALRPPPQPQTIEQAIAELHNKIEELIAAHVAQEKAENPSIPIQSLRQMFDAKHGGRCKCLNYQLAFANKD
jgi:hypothetical protein